MRALIAPDKFKGTLTALEAAASMARGFMVASQAWEAIESPMADGGDGTLEVLRFHCREARWRKETVSGPLGDQLRAEFAAIEGDAWVEMALCSGLGVARGSSPLDASSLGTGQMMRAASSRSGVERAIVAVGGSASTDGGTGAARAWGWRFLDSGGKDLPPGGGALADLAHIEPGSPPDMKFVGACDVDSFLTGEAGAARVFAPQKGASATDVDRLERGLEVLADRIEVDLGVSIRGVRHGGAGGGMGAGLIAFFGAELSYGFDLIADRIGFAEAIASCDLVITGEGSYDGQSARGKVAHRVAAAARSSGIPCALIAGEILVDPEPVFDSWVDVSERYGGERARYEAQSAVAKAAIEVATEYL